MTGEAPRGWDAALTLYRLSMADLDALGNEYEDAELDHYGGAASHAVQEVLHMHAPDWAAFVTKLEILAENDDLAGQRVLSIMLDDARRLGR